MVPTEVDSSALTRLLDVQSEDSAIARLTHRKETLPEAQRLSELRDRLGELRADDEIAAKQAQEAAREQDRLEGEIQILDQKVQREEGRLYSGSVSNPKELKALQDEVGMLKRKRSELEDALLEAMVQREQADATVESLNQETESTAREEAAVTEVVESLNRDIDSELASHRSSREEAAGDVPDDVLSLYEKLRADKGGVGAAALHGDTCEGCHTALPAVEVERLRAEGGLQRCDNCRRILVVTGLRRPNGEGS
jgi:predicted  nucleic acid-binding Zn-ribbon protein